MWASFVDIVATRAPRPEPQANGRAPQDRGPNPDGLHDGGGETCMTCGWMRVLPDGPACEETCGQKADVQLWVLGVPGFEYRCRKHASQFLEDHEGSVVGANVGEETWQSEAERKR